MPAPPHRQLTKRDQSEFDCNLLNTIEAVAESHTYLGDLGERNDLILEALDLPRSARRNALPRKMILGPQNSRGGCVYSKSL
jgi:hypothetical protein